MVRVFDPDNNEVLFHGANDPHTPIAQGWLRASHHTLDLAPTTDYRPYHVHHRVEPLAPGRTYELDVEIWPTSIVIPAGFRLAFTVRSRAYGWDGPPAFLKQIANPLRGCGPLIHEQRPDAVSANDVSVHTGGAAGSCVLLPVIPGN